jgi:hypothetical protein
VSAANGLKHADGNKQDKSDGSGDRRQPNRLVSTQGGDHVAGTRHGQDNKKRS